MVAAGIGATNPIELDATGGQAVHVRMPGLRPWRSRRATFAETREDFAQVGHVELSAESPRRTGPPIRSRNLDRSPVLVAVRVVSEENTERHVSHAPNGTHGGAQRAIRRHAVSEPAAAIGFASVSDVNRAD